MNKNELGRLGESIAEKFLINNGINIINKNYFTKFGEIDLIGIEKKTIIFIEVKLRKNDNYGFPSESISFSKLEKIRKSAEIYLIDNNFSDFDCRFDVISLIAYKNNTDFKIEWIKNQYFY